MLTGRPWRKGNDVGRCRLRTASRALSRLQGLRQGYQIIQADSFNRGPPAEFGLDQGVWKRRKLITQQVDSWLGKEITERNGITGRYGHEHFYHRRLRPPPLSWLDYLSSLAIPEHIWLFVLGTEQLITC